MSEQISDETALLNAYDETESHKSRNFLWPSDNLAVLREFVLCLPQFNEYFGALPQVRVVIDANVALAELIFRVKNRQKANSRTSLHEVIAARTVIAFAPVALIEEVEVNIPRIASRQGISEDCLRTEWGEFKVLLHFYEPHPHLTRPQQTIVDPKDLPYRDLWYEIGAHGVYSKDRHLPMMDAHVITIDVVIALRNYSRAASIEVGIKVGGVVVAAAGIGLLGKIINLLSAVGRGLLRLPPAVKVAIAAIAVIVIAHPRSRNMIKTWFNSIFELLGETALPVLSSATKSLSDAERDRALGWETASKKLPVGKKHPARAYLLAVCIAASKPLSLFELERRVLSAGYVTCAKNLRGYLRRILQNDPCFSQVRPGYWIISRA